MPEARRPAIPINRFASPRRALVASSTQTLANLALFLGFYFAGVGLWGWPRPPFLPAEQESFRSGLLLSFALSVVILFAYRWLAPRIAFKPYYDALVLVRAGLLRQAADYLQKQIRQIEAHPAIDLRRSVLFLDYAEYTYLETAWLTLGFVRARLGDEGGARQAFEAALRLSSNNLLARESLDHLKAVMRDAAREAAQMSEG